VIQFYIFVTKSKSRTRQRYNHKIRQRGNKYKKKSKEAGSKDLLIQKNAEVQIENVESIIRYF